MLSWCLGIQITGLESAEARQWLVLPASDNARYSIALAAPLALGPCSGEFGQSPMRSEADRQSFCCFKGGRGWRPARTKWSTSRWRETTLQGREYVRALCQNMGGLIVQACREDEYSFYVASWLLTSAVTTLCSEIVC